jgi:hypothetical protein
VHVGRFCGRTVLCRGTAVQALEGLPNSGYGFVAILKLLHRLQIGAESGDAGERIPDRHETVHGPARGQRPQRVLAGKRLPARGLGLMRVGECSDVVIGVDRKRRHNRSPWCHALRGRDMDHSEVLERQGDFAINRRGRRSGDVPGARDRKWQEMSQN